MSLPRCRSRFYLFLMLCLAAAPHGALADATEPVACYDAARDLVMHVLPGQCQGQIVSAEKETELARHRALRLQRAVSGPEDPVTGTRRLIGTGSGFYVGPQGEVLTNHHVVEKCDFTTVTSDEGEKIAAMLVGVSPDVDLALLRTGRPPPGIAAFSGQPGNDPSGQLAVVGYPAYGMPVRLSHLSPASTTPAVLQSAERRIAFRGEVRHGNSGSPLLDGNADVVGVVFATVDTAKEYRETGRITDIGVAIPNETTLRFLRQLGLEPRLAGPSRPAMSASKIHDKSTSFVVQIGCWGPVKP